MPNARFAIVSFRDHGNPGGEYDTLRAMTTNTSAIEAALNKLHAVSNPLPANLVVESYNLAFRRSYADPAIGWRVTARKVVLVIGDAEPYDLIVVNSVIQYMSARERRLWLCRWRDLLAPGGRIVLSDLVSPRHHVWDDAVSLCRFYAQHGRLTDALRQRFRDLGLYSRARRMCRLSSVGREELRRDAAAAGLAMQLLATNLTYRTHRTAALLSAD